MLKFLKTIFAKKEAEKEEKSLDRLEEWFNNKAKLIFNDLDEKIDGIRSKISEETGKCAENLEMLQNAELKNPNIPLRAKQAMEGNRDAYIKRVKIFLSGIDLDDKNYDGIVNFCNDFSNELDMLAKSTLKSYQILQHFLANESSEIAANIRNLDSLLKQLKKIVTDSDLKNVGDINNMISGLKSGIKRKDSLREESAAKEEHLEELKKSRENLQKEIGAFRNSEAFTGFQSLKNEKESVKREIGNYQ